MNMTIKSTADGDTMTVTLEGWLDTQAASELSALIEDLPEEIKAVAFDCEKLEYISSSGIRQIVAAYKKVNGNFELRNVSAEIMEILKMTGIAKRVKIV